MNKESVLETIEEFLKEAYNAGHDQNHDYREYKSALELFEELELVLVVKE